MKCPFLRDARVRFCQASAYRKMIVESGPAAGEEVCTSPRHLGCPAAASRLASGEAPTSRCPFLQDAHVEFCAAAPVPKFVPASDGLLSHCSSDAHLYCEVYLNR